ncbi:dihydroorotate dehydrogenase [Savitreella phatthalungensis]
MSRRRETSSCVIGRSRQFEITPALVNAACPWASSVDELVALYGCEWTGAVVTRTSMVSEFPESPGTLHTHGFFGGGTCSINSYGYSPHTLTYYLDAIRHIYSTKTTRDKPFIVSLGGTNQELTQAINAVKALRTELKLPHRTAEGLRDIAIEINLSCPNIPHHRPPCYDRVALESVLKEVIGPVVEGGLVVGLKVAPFVMGVGGEAFVETVAMAGFGGKVAYIAATNTLGNALAFDDQEGEPILPRRGEAYLTGGLAGQAIHPVALGTVHTIANALKHHKETAHIEVIGLGGVADGKAYDRMIRVGASCVGVATAFGREGVEVFGKILNG